MSLPFAMPMGLNAMATAASRLSGLRLDPYSGFNFLVEIDGLLTGGFSRVEGLEGEVVYEEHRQGGSMDNHQFPKGVSYPPLILSHGLTDIDMLWGWFADARRGAGRRKTVSIMLLDAQQLPVTWWYCEGALPRKWSGPTFDASQGEVAVERIELVHQGIKKDSWPRYLLGVARAGLQLSGRHVPLNPGPVGTW